MLECPRPDPKVVMAWHVIYVPRTFSRSGVLREPKNTTDDRPAMNDEPFSARFLAALHCTALSYPGKPASSTPLARAELILYSYATI